MLSTCSSYVPPGSRSPLEAATAAGAVMTMSKRPMNNKSWYIGPVLRRASWASMVFGMASKEYMSPGTRTKSVVMKPTTANMAVRP